MRVGMGSVFGKRSGFGEQLLNRRGLRKSLQIRECYAISGNEGYVRPSCQCPQYCLLARNCTRKQEELPLRNNSQIKSWVLRLSHTNSRDAALPPAGKAPDMFCCMRREAVGKVSRLDALHESLGRRARDYQALRTLHKRRNGKPSRKRAWLRLR
jgi:hypothetical protein